MSSLAVFLVLGGASAYAAKKIGSNEIKGNSITTGKIKKEAVTKAKIKNASVTTSKIADNSITTSKIANDAVTGDKANESTFSKVPSAKVADTTSNVLWAVVRDPTGGGNASLVRSSQPAPTVDEVTGVVVAFNRNVTECAWLATRGLPGAEGAETPGFAEVNGVAGNANAVEVRVRDDEGTIDDGNFHLAVICP
jgi:hypothetical protein